jgi:MoaA/NifB/PqqE/SkfB family radical SAM enzyme
MKKKSDILLILCPPWDVAMPPLGIAYLAAYLKGKGYSPLVQDVNILAYQKSPAGQRALWHQNAYDKWVRQEEFDLAVKKPLCGLIDNFADQIASADASCVGFSVNFSNRCFTVELMRRVRQLAPEKKIILGGFGCFTPHMRSLYPSELVDAFVVGEGEESLCELLEYFAGKREGLIQGAIIGGNGMDPLVPRPALKELDAIPFPTYEGFPLNRYAQRSLPLLISRGCVGRCTFCNDHVMSRPYRFRSAEHVMEEIRYHVKENNRADFSLKDLLCNGNPRELERLCDLIIASGLRISWDSQAICKKDLTAVLLNKMRKAGCQTLIFGVESCSDRILRKMGKLFTVSDVARVLRDAHTAGITTAINIIVGFPGETEDDFRQTWNFILDNRGVISRIGALSTCLINNDSDLQRNSENYGIILPEDHQIQASAWSDDSGNTLQLRRERLMKLKKMLTSNGLECECSNDGEAKKTKQTFSFSLSDTVGKLFAALKKKPVADVCHDILSATPLDPRDPIMLGIQDGSRAFLGPEIVQFDVTNRCNNNCICCWTRSPLLHTKPGKWHEQELPTEMVKSTINELVQMGTKTLFFAGGGEPFMHPGFMDILAEAKKCGLRTIINTNFTLIDEEKINKLVELKVDFMHVSLHAAGSDVYAQMHPNKKPEDFDRIKNMLSLMAGTKNLKSSWWRPHINIYYVICNRNYFQIPSMVDLALELRANSMEFVPIDVVPNATDVLLLTEEQRQAVCRDFRGQVESLKQLQAKFATPITFIEQADTFLKRMSEKGSVQGKYESKVLSTKACYVGWAFSRITADGTVYPCLKAERIPVGNIHKDSFKEIWNGPAQRYFREKTKQFDKNDMYFTNIGNNNDGGCGCLVSCDNMQVNIEIERKFQKWQKLSRRM